MRQLLPVPLDPVDPYDAYRPVDAHAPLLRVNMIASADGAATDEDGRTGGLAGPGDEEVFRVLRAQADAILVGAQTVRTEGYGPHRLRAHHRERRRADGRDVPAAIVVVTRSLALDFASPLFTDAVVPTVVLTCSGADPRGLAAAGRAGRVLVAGDDDVDLVEGVRRLRAELGFSHILCEGGPALNVPLFAAGLVDELCLTIAPFLMGGEHPAILGALGARVPLELVAACEEGGELFLRYRPR